MKHDEDDDDDVGLVFPQHPKFHILTPQFFHYDPKIIMLTLFLVTMGPMTHLQNPLENLDHDDDDDDYDAWPMLEAD